MPPEKRIFANTQKSDCRYAILTNCIVMLFQRILHFNPTTAYAHTTSRIYQTSNIFAHIIPILCKIIISLHPILKETLL